MKVGDTRGGLTAIRKPRPAKLAGFVGMKVLSWTDVAAVAALIAWVCSLLYIQQSHQTFVGTDQIIHYFPAAQKVLEGQGYRAFEEDVYRGPGYPLALAAVTSMVGGDMFAAGKVVGVVSSTLFVLFARLLVRRVFDPTTALASMLLAVGVNTFTWVSCAHSTDLPFACLAMASLYFTGRHQNLTLLDAILAGLLGGLALGVRWNGLLLPLFLLARIALLPRRAPGSPSKAQAVAAYGLAFLLASGPWLYVNYLLHGNPLYTRAAANWDPGDLIVPAGSLLDSLLETLKHEPLGFAQRLLLRVVSGFPKVIQGLNSFPSKGGPMMAGLFWILVPIGTLFLLMRIDRAGLWFLLVSAIWLASLAIAHYESRYYLLLIPTFASLVVFPVTSGALPDVKLAVGQKRSVKLTPGYLLARLVGSRLPGWLTPHSSGTSLASLVVIGFLAVAAFSTVKRVQGGYQWHSEQGAHHHELARLIREWRGAGRLRPVGTRQWSQARYWIPWESGTAVVPLPGRDYESVLPDLSYVLYDQIDDDDVLVDWWDDPNLGALTDPLRAPANLEAVYYKPDSRRAILYRILDQNSPAGIVFASASSALPQSQEGRTFDNDSRTWWSSELHSSDKTPESITFDLGRSTAINRVWLLPRPDGRAFPSRLRIDVGQDGHTWQSVIEEQEVPRPVRQSPQVFSFPETKSRFLRVTATRLQWDEESGGYCASLAEARISLAVGRPAEQALFSIASGDVSFDPLSNELVAVVRNEGSVPGRATVDLAKGWSLQDAKHLATVESSVAPPGGVGVARLSCSQWDPIDPGSWRPIWATLRPSLCEKLALDTYGMGRPHPQTVFSRVFWLREAVIDDFGYRESPLEKEWRALPDQTAAGEVLTVEDRELGIRVMRVSSQAQDGFAIRREMRVYYRPKLTLWIRSASSFIIYVQVRDPDGEYYYVQYMPYAWSDYSEEFPRGRYVLWPLGSYLTDGRWHKLERDVHEDFFRSTQKRVDYIEAFGIRVYERLELADVRLAARG